MYCCTQLPTDLWYCAASVGNHKKDTGPIQGVMGVASSLADSPKCPAGQVGSLQAVSEKGEAAHLHRVNVNSSTSGNFLSSAIHLTPLHSHPRNFIRVRKKLLYFLPIRGEREVHSGSSTLARPLRQERAGAGQGGAEGLRGST